MLDLKEKIAFITGANFCALKLAKNGCKIAFFNSFRKTDTTRNFSIRSRVYLL